jgi:hypothetical protein
MRKTIVLAIVGLLAFVQAASAQFYVGGSFHLSTQFTENPVTQIGFSPDLGYTVGDWCFGSTFELSSTSGEIKRFSFTVNPYVEYYFWSAGAFSFFIEGGAGFSWGDYFNCTPYLAPGVSFQVSDHWSVLGQIGRLGYDTHEKSLVFTTRGAAALSLGLYYSF